MDLIIFQNLVLGIFASRKEKIYLESLLACSPYLFQDLQGNRVASMHLFSFRLVATQKHFQNY